MNNRRTVLITGGNAGIGLAVATEVARRGAQIVLACRNQDKAAQAGERILAAAPAADVRIYPLDLASFASIKKLSARVSADHLKLYVLINNAGAFPTKQEFTEEGFEFQFGVNYLGHFLLTHLLMPALKNAGEARIIHLSSVMHNFGRIDFDSFRGMKEYSGLAAYGQSKLANLLFSNELARRLPSAITSNALHPGGVDTDIYREWSKILYTLMKPFLITPERAALLVTEMALSDEWRGVTGRFKSAHGPLPVSRAGRDAELARRLYEESCLLTGVTPL